VLDGIRVIDLCDVDSALTGALLADMGADVVQVVTRTERSRAERSAYCRGKRLLELPTLSSAAVQPLLDGVDVLLEAWPPGDGFDPALLAAQQPQLIHVSITPFGSRGPKADYAATDLTVTAASGFLQVSGAAGQAPLRISAPQAVLHAAADAAVAVLIALRARGDDGAGQHIDVSAQQSQTLALLGRGLDAAVGQPRAERASGVAQIGGVRVRTLFPVRDGWVLVSAGVLPPVAAFQRRLLSWAAESGHCAHDLIAWDWGNVAMQMLGGAITQADWDPVERAVAALLAPLTKAEVMAAAVQRKLLIAPVLHVGELLDSAQLRSREFVQRPPDGRPHLGPFARLTASPLPQRHAVGTATPADLQRDWQRRAAPRRSAAERPLAGVKVLDLFWVVAGPGATRMLADYGATVIHVESRHRLDMLRSVPPYVDGLPDPERAAGFHSTNANKLNLSLDLSSDAGRLVLADLIAWADVFGESFSPGVIERLGFGYAAARALNPSIIMISSSLLGQSGPWRDYAGFGNLAGAVSGFYQLTGMPDEPPTGCFGPYTDFMGVRFNALAILAALRHRDRTGDGQYIDMAQAEAALAFLAPAAAAYLERGEIPQPRGNRDPDMAPHGVFPAEGCDRWVAIAVRSDAEWQVLCDHAGLGELAADAALATASGRQRAASRVEAALAAWTRPRRAVQIESELQALGIAAHAVLDTHELLDEPQLRFRGYLKRIDHPQFGSTAIETSRFALSAAPAELPRQAVCYGSGNDAVLRDILGYTAEQIAALQAAGVLQ
jgi:crotonobetainyl-CoA:carnitine CoA-transferase CaiB-like acyl-CoA transferase